MKILLIDDDINLCKVIAYQLQKRNFTVTTANFGKEGLKHFKNQSFDIVISDIQMPDISGIDVLKEIRRLDKQVVFIIITAYGSVDSAIDACRLGADDYLTKPFGQEQLFFVIEKAVRLKKLQEENVQLKQEIVNKYSIKNFVAQSTKMQNVLKTVLQMAKSDSTVLIQGESGTGKELIAKAVHYHSLRKDKPMVVVNCPSIPENLLESELFGHVKGAFTGALKDRKGKFELANGGTIFLDEIGDLKEELQAKLLRVLQEKEIEQLGESKVIKIDVRVIAATNSDLQEKIREGKFREDLYYRLSVLPVVIPSLRQRKDEIPYLIDFFMKKYSKDKKYIIASNVIEILQQFDWPGNVRELENVVEHAIVMSLDNIITKDQIPTYLHKPERGFLNLSGQSLNENLTLQEIESQAIQNALKKTNGNQTKAAKLLKIPRHVLLYRLQKFGLKASMKEN